jgi:radical SAM-linked protein
MRFTGHLDLQRTWERWFRRARLPLYYSQGYTPRPRMHIAMALPLGFSGEQELLDLWLTREMEPAQILEALRDSRPPGLRILDIQQVPERGPALQTQVHAASYRAVLDRDIDVDRLSPRLDGLLSADSAPRIRRDKEYDLRPLIETLRLREDDEGRQVLDMRLRAGQSGTGRPDEVLRELQVEPAGVHIRRREILFNSEEDQ